ncbi:hypothetical protein ABZ016_26765 [Streptomyces sp. NPDC006372]|uniref:hypothetical protein n=1 Tax=Streptomyces sp. NPDC006372 TaxID=3155599 RepID=UPI0033B06EF9
MADEERNEAEAPTFLSSMVEVARLLDINNAVSVREDRRARHLAHAVRRPLLQRASLPEEFFAPLMAAAVYDAGTGTDAEQAGAKRTWYCAHLMLRADRSPAYAPHLVVAMIRP